MANYFQKTYNAEVLKEWLTLEMKRNAISMFLETRSKYLAVLLTKQHTERQVSSQEGSIPEASEAIPNGHLTRENIEATMDSTINGLNDTITRATLESDSFLRLRRAKNTDAQSILDLVNGLAIYEKEPHEVDVTLDIYFRDCEGESPFFHCVLLEEMSCEDLEFRKVVGMGFWYLGYTIKGGRHLYLEDLFIQTDYRGHGCGKAIMYCLAEIASTLKCQRFIWQALDWNTPALNFYKSIGANICSEFTTIRLNQGDMKTFSASSSPLLKGKIKVTCSGTKYEG